MKKVGIIIPTVRRDSILTFLEKWDFPSYCKLYVIEDNPQKNFRLPNDHYFYGEKDVWFHGSWQNFKNIKNSWIFSKNCGGGIRTFGFWKAYQEGCDYFLSLDDDCLPTGDCNGEKLVEEHIKKLETNNGRWLWTTKNTRPRGVPYRNLGVESETLINMGFWRKNADFDAPTQLLCGSIEVPPNILDPIPNGYYVPVCGMNLSFKRKAVPLMFQSLMGKIYGVWRFDDIWCGIIAKKICDHLGYLIRAGSPDIVHSRASNIWANLKKEADGLETNEDFWEVIDNIELKGKTVKDCYSEVADVLKKREEEYCKLLGVAMEFWIELF